MKDANGRSRKPPLPDWLVLTTAHCGRKLSVNPGRPFQRLNGWRLYLGDCPVCQSTFTVDAEKDA